MTGPVAEGGLGFTFKWNMGWMHDTLDYFALDPIHRRYHHELLTFSMMYEYSEHFIMPLSHDEVVHGKGTLLGEDAGRRVAALRQPARAVRLPVHPAGQAAPLHGQRARLVPGVEPRQQPRLASRGASRCTAGCCDSWPTSAPSIAPAPSCGATDPDLSGFSWLDADDRDHSIYSYFRRDGDRILLVLLNLTPVPRHDYRSGAPRSGRYSMVLSSDDPSTAAADSGSCPALRAEPVAWQNQPASFRIGLPPLGAVLLAYDPE